MSRRHTSNRDIQQLIRVLGGALVVLIALTAVLPAVVSAQAARVRDQDVEQRWQLLTYRDASGDLTQVPAGVGATLQLFSNSAFGDAACSSYSSRYTRSEETLFIDPPNVQYFDCDPASQAFDETFYRNLEQTASLAVSPSILTLRDVTNQPLMTLTRAVIDGDPTVARWDLARIGTADGNISPVIQGLDPWIKFLPGGSLVGSSGCGPFLGYYTINDGTIDITDVAYRLKTCTEGARQQAQAIIATLDEITDFDVLPAGMALKDDLGTTRLALIPAIDLGLRTWTPIEIYDAGGDPVFGPLRLNTSAVWFGNGVAEGRSICRFFKADSLRSGLALSVTNTELDKRAACPKPAKAKTGEATLQEVEDAFIGALEAASSHALRGSELELKDVNGNTLMRLLPQADLVGPTWVVAWMDVTPNKAKSTKRAPKNNARITATFEDIEVVLGETGAADRSGANMYVASYRTPAATKIRIWDATVDGRACNGTKASRPTCKQQRLFLSLLQSADGVIVRETELRLLKGTRPIISFAPEILATTE